MLPRILLDPTPVDGGGTATPTPTPTVPPTATPPPTPTAPPVVPLTVDEYNRLKAAERRLADADADAQAKLDAKERERLKALADKGETEQALTQLEQKWQGKYTSRDQQFVDLEREYFGEKKVNAIHAQLAGVRFRSPEAATDALDKLDRRLEARRDDSGKVIVRCRETGRPASDVIKESLASPAFAHFLEPTSQGGGGVGGGGKAAPTTQPNAATADPAARRAEQLRASIEANRSGAIGLSGVGRN
jgi:hypothetical protein